MSTISASTTTTTAYKVTADTTGTLVLQTGASPTTAVTIDGSQNVGVGTSSPSALTEIYKSSTTNPSIFYVTNPSTTGTFAAAQMALRSYNGSSVTEGLILSSISNSWSYGNTLANSAQVYTGLSNGLALISENASGFIRFLTGSTASERARIDSSGNLLVGTTSATSGGASCKEVVYISNFATTAGISVQGGTNNAGTFFQTVNYAGTINGSITQTNASTIAYNTTSDYRLKENIAPMTGALSKVVALNPVTYTWKLDGAQGQGFIAHELQAVVPDAVTGEKDAVNEDGSIKPQSIDTSFLVATLTAAIQEMKTIIDQQAQRITALENK